MCLSLMIAALIFADRFAGLDSESEAIPGLAAQGPSGLGCTTGTSWHGKVGGTSECIKVKEWLKGVIQSSGSDCLC